MNSNFTTEHTSFASEYMGPQAAPPSRFDIKRIIRHCVPFVFGALLLLGIPAAAAIWFLVPLEYNATGELHFRLSTPKVMEENDNTSQDRQNYEKWLTTQLDFLQGPTILQKVAQNRELRTIPEVSEVPDLLGFLQSKVQATSKKDSELVTVSVHMKDKSAAELICRLVMEEYLTYHNAAEQNMNRERADTLRDEKVKQEDTILRLNQDILDLQKKVGMPKDSVGQIGPNQSVSYVEEKSTAESDQLKEQKIIERIDEQIIQLEALTAGYKANPSEKIFDLEIESKVTSDNRIQNLREDLADKETETGVLRNSSSKTNPALQKAEKDLTSMRGRVAEEEADVRGQYLEAKAAELRMSLEEHTKNKEDAEDRMETFTAKITEQEQTQLAAAETTSVLKEKESLLETHRTRLEDVQKQIDQLNLERNAPARVSETSQPIVPETPDYSKRIQLMLLALVGSLALGAGLGLWRELTNQHARTVQDVSSITPLPVLAAVPHAKMERLPKDYQPEMLMADFPQSPTAEQFRRVLTRIIYPPDDTVEVNSCLIVSPTRGDGKTSLACNLAISLAQANRRVLLVDVCTGDPRIERCFGLEPGQGLSEVLFHDVSYRILVRSTEFSDLKVLGPGFHGDPLKGKLASREMMQFLERAERDFDHIIIDTPPSLLMSDAKLLAPIVDGVIVTVGVGSSTLGMVRRCLSELDQVNANLIGVVLNGVKQTRGGYMSKNLELFYGYGNGHRNGGSMDDLPEMTISDRDEDLSPEFDPAVILLDSDDPETKPGSKDGD